MPTEQIKTTVPRRYAYFLLEGSINTRRERSVVSTLFRFENWGFSNTK